MITENLLVQIKLTKNSQLRMAKQCERQRNQYKKKMYEAFRGGDEKIIRLYAEQSTQQNNMRVLFERMAVQTDILYQKAMTARLQRSATQNLIVVARIMASMSKHQTPEAMVRACDSLKESSEMMEMTQSMFGSALTDMTASTTPEDEVIDLIARVSDEHGIDMRQQFSNAPSGSLMAAARDRSRPSPQMAAAAAAADTTQDTEIQNRLSQLKSP